ncbi:retrovirus-related pol polyprotein from transposon TNT 1-94 [Tanacetum coccineum]
MHSSFEMSLMGEMKFFLGLQIHQSSRGIFINQAKYALEIFKKYGMEKCDTVGTPMANKPKLDTNLSGKLVDQTDYHSITGSLMYLTSSRPDIVQEDLKVIPDFELTTIFRCRPIPRCNVYSQKHFWRNTFPRYKRRCCGLIPVESDSSPHAHAQATKTYYKHQDSRIKKAQELKTKTSGNSDIKDNSSGTKL